jgi:uncharacterized protein YjbI with pentapeptide repeats
LEDEEFDHKAGLLGAGPLRQRSVRRIIANGSNFSRCIMKRTNLVQASLDGANFEGADLTEALLMYTEMKNAHLSHAILTGTNLMWANLPGADFSRSKMTKTIMVEANLQDAKLEGVDKANAYVKYAKLDGTMWFEKAESH